MKTINIALMGYGVVGRALEEIYLESKNRAQVKLLELTGERLDFNLKWIFLRDKNTSVKSLALRSHDYEEILQDREVDIVVELLGGLEPASSIMKKAMEEGKSVVTANKYALYEAGGALEELALAKNVNLGYEAAVAAAVPLLDTLRNRMFFERIEEVTGILNGTTNYILSSMARGMAYDEALKRAEELGYLEADPSLDLEGYDSLHKISILHKLAFGFYPKRIYREGIGAAGKLKGEGKIKLLARARPGRVEVALRRVGSESPFYLVDNGINAIRLKTYYTKELFFSGPGAGGRETALSVWSDILSQVRILSGAGDTRG